MDNRRAHQPPRAPAALPYSHSSPTLTSRTAPSPINGSSLSNESRTAPLAAPAERCTTCRKGVSGNEMQKGGDGHVFCRTCYAERFLPDCRRCRRKIEGGAVTSSDGKVAGKYHPKCFTCWECSASFAGSEFYVFDQRPYCQQHWHALNGSLCANPKCGSPIEGPCVSLVGEENGDHPEHFVCSTCSEPLPEHHFVVNGLPYCERHAQGPPPTARPRKAGQQEPAAARARKRQTIITRR
ncbi:hypothetical protein BCR35DRAFT_262950 [Leucosporidium creatinivorum]|uniref:LIM zinc-binding domain-containing protein n=1 Tax=Leucosporidium creatinivorum TaxID=106004 RepID=A0A1Y2FXR3_9BASI|nr:hypothetical protein BCR35DRAFT_262950 [Leucosporidium creatinivorum]